MMPGELDHKRFGPDTVEVGRTPRTVIAVRPPPERDRNTGGIEDRRQAASDGSQIGLSLPDVVKEHCPGNSRILGPARGDLQRSVEAVSLVGGHHRPEKLSLLSPQPRVDTVLLPRS